MMNETFDPLNLILLIVAAIVFWRLRSVLGSRTGHEKPGLDPYGRSKQQAEKPAPKQEPAMSSGEQRPDEALVVPMISNEEKVEKLVARGEPFYDVLLKMVSLDNRFEPAEFVKRAENAHEMILTAFASGDKKTLKPLLEPSVYKGFASAIDEREKSGERNLLAVAGYDKVELIDVDLEGTEAELTLAFHSKLIRAVKDKLGKVIDGDEKAIQYVKDVWTFRRNLKGRNPNWVLVETS